jgi:lipopolysaccharide export system permease protein
MKNGLLERYLAREVLTAWLGVIAVLLAIMLSTRFASFLSMAAKGQLPRDLLFEVVALSSLRFMVILMPVSLLLAVMLSLGRLYSDNEIAAMTGCGVSLGNLYRPFLKIAVLLAGFTALLSFYLGPWAGQEADYLVKDARRLMQYTPFEPGRFKSVAGDRAVFYTASIDKTGAELGQVFAQIQGREGPSVVAAPSGHQTIDPATGDRIVTLHDGYRYLGQPGTANYDVVQFKELELHVSPPTFTYINSQRKLASTADLLGSSDREDRAELEFRIAMPVSVLILALLAVPMSHLAPRQGRYAKVAYGIVAYLLYANLITIVQNTIAKGHAPPLSLWAIHAAVLAVALGMIGQRQGWWHRA